MNVSPSVDHEVLARTIPLDRLDPSDPKLFQDDVWMPYFARLRKEDPVHHCSGGRFGPFWSVTKYKDIMTVETSHSVYSSEARLGGISITDRPAQFSRRSFITMDPPEHRGQRRAVQPIVAPTNLALMEGLIRERTASVLDTLPRNETFNWVDLVSIELTTRMLATLFDVPFEDRRKLTYWSDVSTADVNAGGEINSEEKRFEILQECLDYFTEIRTRRAKAPPSNDLISMLAHGTATRNQSAFEFLSTLTLLIVGGNDTTRNSMSGSVLFVNQNPTEYKKLRRNPHLVESMVPEVIRYQTPLSHMRRTAIQDTELGGKKIKKGDKVVMWYISGNRDGDAIENPDAFIIDRERPRQHLSFGFGIHRCVGLRLAELQLRVLWEEILKRFDTIEVVDRPKRVYSSFVRGISELMVRIPG